MNKNQLRLLKRSGLNVAALIVGRRNPKQRIWSGQVKFFVELPRKICLGNLYSEGPEHYISHTCAADFIITMCSFLDSLILKSALGCMMTVFRHQKSSMYQLGTQNG